MIYYLFAVKSSRFYYYGRNRGNIMETVIERIIATMDANGIKAA